MTGFDIKSTILGLGFGIVLTAFAGIISLSFNSDSKIDTTGQQVAIGDIRTNAFNSENKIQEKNEKNPQENVQQKTQEKVHEMVQETVKEKTQENVQDKSQDKVRENVQEKAQEKTQENALENVQEKPQEKSTGNSDEDNCFKLISTTVQNK